MLLKLCGLLLTLSLVLTTAIVVPTDIGNTAIAEERQTRSLFAGGTTGVIGDLGAQQINTVQTLQTVPVVSNVQTVQHVPVVQNVQTVQHVPVVSTTVQQQQQLQPVLGGFGGGGIGVGGFAGAGFGGGFHKYRESYTFRSRGFGGGLGGFGGGGFRARYVQKHAGGFVGAGGGAVFGGGLLG